MAKFKIGQLVMVIAEFNLSTSPRKGMIGEVIPFPPGPYSADVTVDVCNAVLFPNLPSKSVSKAWGFRDSELIAINDPDADISDKTEEVLTLKLEGVV